MSPRRIAEENKINELDLKRIVALISEDKTTAVEVIRQLAFLSPIG